MSRTWKITVDEEELHALIEHHSIRHSIAHGDGFKVERSSRIHDLTKRLNKKDEPEIEKEEEQPKITEEQAKANIPAGW